MKNRRSFLATVASGGVGLTLANAAPAGAQVTAAPSPAPSATKLPSFQAAALAERFKVEFDPGLTDEQRTAIASAIDANRKAAQALNPKQKRLKNGDEPILRFAAPGGDA